MHPFELSENSFPCDSTDRKVCPLKGKLRRVKCVNCLVTTPIGSGCVVLIGGFFFYSTLLHEVPADPPMGLSEYRLDQASQRSRGLLVLCNKGSGRIHRLLGQTSQAVPREKKKKRCYV